MLSVAAASCQLQLTSSAHQLIMDDLDILLQDLEATIPENKPARSAEATFEDDLNPNANMAALDSLLMGLSVTHELSTAGSGNREPEFIQDNRRSDSPPPPPPQQTDAANAAMSNTSAAQQLDDLMASLSDFQGGLNRHSSSSDKSEPPYAKPEKSKQAANANVGGHQHQHQPAAVAVQISVDEKKQSGDLDEMLKDMNTNLVKQGIRAASKGVCGACGKPVMGEVTTALGQVWHPEHFVCVVCDAEIGTKTFFEREGKPYCENDYQRLFAPTCAGCSQPVLGQCVTALNKTWHPEHFFCSMCGNFFGDDGFHEHQGKPYCRADYYNIFAPKCGGCMKPILTNYISALNAKWHPECFVCGECMAPFTHGSFFELEGLPYCETHYHGKRGSLCAGCQKPITSRCISAMGKKFHQEHFVCAFCLKQLNKGTFKEQNDKPYCHQCFVKLFGKTQH